MRVQVGLVLAAGSGDDEDTLGKKLVWVMDSTHFPFFQAEVRRQARLLLSTSRLSLYLAAHTSSRKRYI